jgi:adenylate cyclase
MAAIAPPPTPRGPGFTVKQWANIKWSDDPQFQREYARIVEGLRKAGLPEGEKNTN